MHNDEHCYFERQRSNSAYWTLLTSLNEANWRCVMVLVLIAFIAFIAFALLIVLVVLGVLDIVRIGIHVLISICLFSAHMLFYVFICVAVVLVIRRLFR